VTSDSFVALIEDSPGECRQQQRSQLPAKHRAAADTRAGQVPFIEGRLVPVIAHELRGPLATLATSSELLLEDLPGLETEQIRQMVSTIHRSALWLQGLLENLLCAAALGEGEFKIQPKPISLIDVISEVWPIVGPMLDQRKQPLHISSRGVLGDVAGDSRRIGQVLVNLISNASKFAAAGTDIEVTVVARGGYQRVCVADHGPGIPVGSCTRLFQPYQQMAPSCGSTGGIGLGLSIVKSIIEAHGGQVGASNRRGGGASFWFELAALPMASLPCVHTPA
jgi:signal transduction histidine kinase